MRDLRDTLYLLYESANTMWYRKSIWEAFEAPKRFLREDKLTEALEAIRIIQRRWNYEIVEGIKIGILSDYTQVKKTEALCLILTERHSDAIKILETLLVHFPDADLQQVMKMAEKKEPALTVGSFLRLATGWAMLHVVDGRNEQAIKILLPLEAAFSKHPEHSVTLRALRIARNEERMTPDIEKYVSDNYFQLHN